VRAQVVVDADARKRLVVPAANLATPIVFEASETTKLDKVPIARCVCECANGRALACARARAWASASVAARECAPNRKGVIRSCRSLCG
jgi:hypothetical protein